MAKKRVRSSMPPFLAVIMMLVGLAVIGATVVAVQGIQDTRSEASMSERQVRTWEFNGSDMEGWTVARASAAVNDGMLRLTVSEGQKGELVMNNAGAELPRGAKFVQLRMAAKESQNRVPRSTVQPTRRVVPTAKAMPSGRPGPSGIEPPTTNGQDVQGVFTPQTVRVRMFTMVEGKTTWEPAVEAKAVANGASRTYTIPISFIERMKIQKLKFELEPGVYEMDWIRVSYKCVPSSAAARIPKGSEWMVCGDEALKPSPAAATVCYNRVTTQDGALYWPDGCKGNPPSADLMCTQALVRLTEREETAYRAWVASGKPVIAGCLEQAVDGPTGYIVPTRRSLR